MRVKATSAGQPVTEDRADERFSASRRIIDEERSDSLGLKPDVPFPDPVVVQQPPPADEDGAVEVAGQSDS